MARRGARRVDRGMLWAVGILLVAGLFILTSASFGLSTAKFNSPYFLVSRQLSGIALGLIAMFILAQIPYRTWRKFALPLLIVSVALLVAVFLPGIGESYQKGAQRWINVGPIQFQPAEVVKITFLIYLAAWLDAKRKHVHSFADGFVPFAVLTGFVGVFLLLQPNISALLILGGASLGMFFVGGGRTVQIIGGIVAGIALILLFMWVTGYNFDRIAVYLNPDLDPQGKGYQIRQALIAVGSGGLFGKGFGNSTQKLSRLPEPVGDSIFAILSEELGFVGSIILLGCFAFFFLRGTVIAARAPDGFGRLLATGIMLVLFIQTCTNIAAFIGLMPVTGTPLPFISYGRTAMVSALASTGIILNISRHRS